MIATFQPRFTGMNVSNESRSARFRQRYTQSIYSRTVAHFYRNGNRLKRSAKTTTFPRRGWVQQLFNNRFFYRSAQYFAQAYLCVLITRYSCKTTSFHGYENFIRHEYIQSSSNCDDAKNIFRLTNMRNGIERQITLVRIFSVVFSDWWSIIDKFQCTLIRISSY